MPGPEQPVGPSRMLQRRFDVAVIQAMRWIRLGAAVAYRLAVSMLRAIQGWIKPGCD